MHTIVNHLTTCQLFGWVSIIVYTSLKRCVRLASCKSAFERALFSNEGKMTMDITVTGRRMNVSDALRDYAEEKIGNSMKAMDRSAS